MKKLLLLIILTFSFAECFSQDWIEVTTTSTGDKIFIADKYIKKGGTYGHDEGVFRVWKKTIMKKFESKHLGRIKVYENVIVKSLDEYDCINQKTRSITFIMYDSNGEVIVNGNNEEYAMNWEFVVPETVGEAVFIYACKLFN